METVVPRAENGNILRKCYNCQDFEETIPCYIDFNGVRQREVFLCLACMEMIDYDRHLKKIGFYQS